MALQNEIDEQVRSITSYRNGLLLLLESCILVDPYNRVKEQFRIKLNYLYELKLCDNYLSRLQIATRHLNTQKPEPNQYIQTVEEFLRINNN